jgi:hypothetical protein
MQIDQHYRGSEIYELTVGSDVGERNISKCW